MVFPRSSCPITKTVGVTRQVTPTVFCCWAACARENHRLSWESKNGFSLGQKEASLYAEGLEHGEVKKAKEMALKLNQKGIALKEIDDLVGFNIATVGKWLTQKAV